MVNGCFTLHHILWTIHLRSCWVTCMYFQGKEHMLSLSRWRQIQKWLPNAIDFQMSSLCRAWNRAGFSAHAGIRYRMSDSLSLSLSLILSDFMQSQRLITPAPQMANSITFLFVECRMVEANGGETSYSDCRFNFVKEIFHAIIISVL